MSVYCFIMFVISNLYVSYIQRVHNVVFNYQNLYGNIIIDITFSEFYDMYLYVLYCIRILT